MRNRHSALLRLVVGIVGALLAAWLWPVDSRTPVQAHVVMGWNVGATLVLAMNLWIILSATAAGTQRRAAVDDPGRLALFTFVVLGSTVSVMGSLIAVREGSSVGSVVWAAASAWLLTQTTFALRYAHLFYSGHQSSPGGLAFPEEQRPDDLDFAYFALTLGMCFQVSDVVITRREMRRTALLHAALSFVYNVAILALVVNVVLGGLAGS